MIDIVCQAPFFFCIASGYAPVLEVAGPIRVVRDGRPVIADPQAAARLGVKVQVVAGDNFGDLPAQSLRQTCIDRACVVFRMACRNLTCSWQVAPLRAEGRRALQEIRLVATSPQALAAARTRVFVAIDGGGKVALSDLGEGVSAPAGAYLAPVWPGDRRLGRRAGDSARD